MSDPTDAPEPKLPPLAPLDARIKAGAVDLAALGLIVGVYFAGPLLMGGLTLPMWGVFAAVLGYAVTPLLLFRATLGMRLFGVELLGKNGHPAQIIDVIFRELIGRGFFPAAYLSTMAAALIATWLGLLQFAMPAGMGTVLFHLSWMLLAGTTLGHFLVFTRPDRRSLADLVSKTVVVVRTPKPLPTDAEERAWALGERSGRIRNLVIAEVVIVALGVGLPYGLTRDTPGENTADYAERLKRKKLQRQFDGDPGNRKLARELTRAYRYAGEMEAAEAVQQQHAAALSLAQQKSEEALRKRVEADPWDDEGLGLLLELLLGQGRRQEAVEAYRRAVTFADSPERRMEFGIWLYDLGMYPLAEVELTLALDAGLKDGWAFTYRGHARLELGRKAEARDDYAAALEVNPDLLEAEDGLVALDAEGLAQDVP